MRGPGLKYATTHWGPPEPDPNHDPENFTSIAPGRDKQAPGDIKRSREYLKSSK